MWGLHMYFKMICWLVSLIVERKHKERDGFHITGVLN